MYCPLGKSSQKSLELTLFGNYFKRIKIARTVHRVSVPSAQTHQLPGAGHICALSLSTYTHTPIIHPESFMSWFLWACFPLLLQWAFPENRDSLLQFSNPENVTFTRCLSKPQLIFKFHHRLTKVLYGIFPTQDPIQGHVIRLIVTSL